MCAKIYIDRLDANGCDDADDTHADAVGEGNDKHTHVSVYVYLMRGDNDNNLKWPIRFILKMYYKV